MHLEESVACGRRVGMVVIICSRLPARNTGHVANARHPQITSLLRTPSWLLSATVLPHAMAVLFGLCMGFRRP